jgi:hypothetical protein
MPKPSEIESYFCTIIVKYIPPVITISLLFLDDTIPGSKDVFLGWNF